MKKDYDFFHNLLISWWKGTKTKNEIIGIVNPIFKIEKISQWSDFINDFEESIRKYDDKYYFHWIEYKEKILHQQYWDFYTRLKNTTLKI